MKHPTHEDWMAYLYEELPRPARKPLEAHLADCPACAANVRQWQQTQHALDQWRLPLPGPAHAGGAGASRTLVRWAMAALFIFGTGFALARWTAPTPPALDS